MLPNFSSFGDPEIALFVRILALKARTAQVPALPAHLDELIDKAWTPEASRLLDLWTFYRAEEFELVDGGAR